MVPEASTVSLTINCLFCPQYSEESTAIPGVGVDALLDNGKLDRFKNGPIYWIDSADSNPCIGKSIVVLYYCLL